MLGTLLVFFFFFLFEVRAMFMAPKIFLLMQMKIIRASASGQVRKELLCGCEQPARHEDGEGLPLKV